MIDHVKHVTIPVADQDRALAFYTRTLGFEVTTDAAFGPGRRWIEIAIPGSKTKLTLFTPEGMEGRIGGFSGVVFGTSDIEATYAELVAKGVEFVQPLQKESWGTSAIFKDLDGTTFVLSTED